MHRFPSAEKLSGAVSCLKRGGLVSFPTDTLYALGADAMSAEAVGRVIQVKKRPRHMGLPVFLGCIDDLQRVAVDVGGVAWQLARRFWPGPLTLVLRKAPSVLSIVTGDRDSVAVRVPYHPVALALIREFGGPVTGTSANLHGGPDPLTVAEVSEALGDVCQVVLDGGPLPEGVSSTIVDVSNGRAKLLRNGPIPWSEVESVAGTDYP